MASNEKEQSDHKSERTGHGRESADDSRAAGKDQEFAVVGIGASAGGLRALTELLAKMPADSGIALVVVTHQHPDRESLLPELLGRETDLPVSQAAHGMKLCADQVYIAPPGGYLDILDGVLFNPQRDAAKSPPLPVDHFFRSLAADRKERAVCVILSGTGSDGTHGLRAIKAEGGMAMVQAPATAEYSGMPASAAATGLVDFILPPAEMPEKLVAFVRGPYLSREKVRDGSGGITGELLQEITEALRLRTGHDFGQYKESTTRRRMERRMSVHQISKPSEYLHYVREDPHELDLLFKDLLINVTSFFRDPGAWDALAEGPLRELLEALPDGHTFRAWSPGCSGGEESYSLAVVLREVMEKIGREFKVQIFGTDLDADSIDSARAGRFPEAIAADVGPERLKRWFSYQDKFYRINGEIREMTIFAQQSLVGDPPFTRLDLLSCRNVLIYMKSELQKQLLPVFHYALRPGGLLMLGTSESIGEFSDLFVLVNKNGKIFRRLDTPSRLGEISDRRIFSLSRGASPARRRGKENSADPNRRERLVDKAVLGALCPPSVVVTASGEIVQVYGRTGMFLEPAQGGARMNLFAMAREGLSHHLSTLLRRVRGGEESAIRRRVRVKTNGGEDAVDLSVTRFREQEALEGLFLVSFQPSSRPRKTGGAGDSAPFSDERRRSVAELERELQEGRENNRSSTEELETANEELQSANEELESSKEELQSLNEELNTVNAKLHNKVEELSQANSDMQNLLGNTHIATLFLDTKLNILRFTDHARRLIRLTPGDVGRPIGDLVSPFKHNRLEADCREVLRTLKPREAEVESGDGVLFQMRIGPYRTASNVVSGVVVTFVGAGEARSYFESIVHTVRHPLIVLGNDLRVVSANRAFLRRFGLRANRISGQRFYGIGKQMWDIPELRRLLEEILPRDTSFDDFDVELTDSETGEQSLFVLNARRLQRPDDKAGMILLAFEEETMPPAKNP